MHWLQTLDTNLFFFVNRSLVNPFFDWLMPLLSNNAFFFPVLLLLVIGLLWKGGRRMRVCILMLALILPLGDNLICNTIKHTVARPRPFVTLPEARLFGEVGKGYIPPEINDEGVDMSASKGSRNSMPSSHAANWFAATMILFIYYRRSVWFMLPLALGVSFSRVYNGAHYPSDVLAGMILGAGYAVAFIVMFETSWQFAGRKWFPIWHEKLPSLLNPKPSTLNSSASAFSYGATATKRSEGGQLSTPASHWLHLGYVLIFVMLIGRWIYIASGTIDLEKDEAYQWLWSKHLALSYYSKPPGIALIQFTGTHIFGDTQFGVRFFSPLFAAILSIVALRFLAREIGAGLALLLLLIVTATPLLGIGTILMTIDPPLVLCWTWAIIAGWRAVQPDGKTRDWLMVGLAMGLGFLCKYTAAVQLVCWVLFFALSPMARAHLKKSGPWLALLVFLVCTTPVVVWNWQHGWITITHVSGDAGMHSQWKPTLRYFWDFIFSQAGLLNPVFFVGAIWAMFGFWKFRRERPLWLFFFCMSAPLFFGYGLWSFHSRVLPNWPVAAVPPMFCLMVVYWDEKFRNGARFVRPFLTAGLVIGFVALPFMYESNLIGKVVGNPLPGEKDLLRRVRVWKPTAMLVENAREKLEAEGKPAFIITDHYGITGEFTFYLPQARAALDSKPLVYCIDSDAPDNQLYFWPEYNYREHRKGENAIFISELDPYPLESGWFGKWWVWKWLTHQKISYANSGPTRPPFSLKHIAPEFETVTDLGEREIKLGGRVFRRVHLWACYNLK